MWKRWMEAGYEDQWGPGIFQFHFSVYGLFKATYLGFHSASYKRESNKEFNSNI